ncbi:translation initiation factor IF-2-like isoform X2 [Peromyscus californicus insignis]|uniref:translation initiation factor IF-2-like isoform X2 n=1 Tax=Peromyscus californicus insignis TaxID=564181 RepID=UPI0022A7C2A2|nr:translation initiation factor IF-2-like isoform X2 [Peromyscus californicus insignis]
MPPSRAALRAAAGGGRRRRRRRRARARRRERAAKTSCSPLRSPLPSPAPSPVGPTPSAPARLRNLPPAPTTIVPAHRTPSREGAGAGDAGAAEPGAREPGRCLALWAPGCSKGPTLEKGEVRVRWLGLPTPVARADFIQLKAGWRVSSSLPCQGLCQTLPRHPWELGQKGAVLGG